MRFFDMLGRGVSSLFADASGTPAAWDDYWYEPLGQATASGMRVSPGSMLRVAAYQACVRIVARTMGMLPIKIYTEAPDGSKKLVDHHPLYDVLYIRPNEQQTAYEFKEMMEGHVELRGTAYAEIVPGKRGAVDQLLPMHPDRVKPGRARGTGRIVYTYDDPVRGTRTLLQEEVFRLAAFSEDGITGRTPASMSGDIVGVALAQQDYAARFLKNDARPPIYFEGANFKNKEQEERFTESWQRGGTGPNRGKAPLLPLGMSIKELGVKPIDQQLLDARKLSRIDIASLFPVPGHMIGETEKTATYASVEQQNINFVTHCILPRCVMWEQAIQRDLLTNPRYFAKISLAALLRGDTAARYTAYHTAIGDGWLSQDEVRAFEDLNPIPGGAGRRYWRPVNWAPLDQNNAPAAAISPIADPVDPEDGSSPDAPGGDPGDDAEASTRIARLSLLASSAADRCTRKEVGALRRMVERGASNYEFEEFYDEHLQFVATVLGLDPAALAEPRQRYFERASQLDGALRTGDKAAALALIDHIAANETMQLAALAAGGTR